MFDASIQYAAQTYNVPANWIKAVIQVESNWNPEAYNASDPTGAWGLMQLLLSTARGLGYLGPGEGLFDPSTNILYGAKLLGQLRIQYGDDFNRVYSAYNSGDPDLWETSTEVYNNVMRAVDALQSFVESNPATSGGIGLVVLLLALWLFRKGF
jgi:soluble lytic murein transglycosylase-like protein